MFFGGYKPTMLQKWRQHPPAPAKLARLWPQMSGDERSEAAQLIWAEKWPENWLDKVNEAAAREMLAALWPYSNAPARLGLLKLAVGKLMAGGEKRKLLLALLAELPDDQLPELLLDAALAEPEKLEVSAAAALLAPWREDCGVMLGVRFPVLPQAARGWALRLAGELNFSGVLRLFDRALADPSEDIRVLAAKMLQTCGLPAAAELEEYLAPALADAVPAVRMAACETLGKVLGTAAIPELRRRLAAEEAWQVKAMCASFIDSFEARLAEDIRREEGELYFKDGDKNG